MYIYLLIYPSKKINQIHGSVNIPFESHGNPSWEPRLAFTSWLEMLACEMGKTTGCFLCCFFCLKQKPRRLGIGALYGNFKDKLFKTETSQVVCWGCVCVEVIYIHKYIFLLCCWTLIRWHLTKCLIRTNLWTFKLKIWDVNIKYFKEHMRMSLFWYTHLVKILIFHQPRKPLQPLNTGMQKPAEMSKSRSPSSRKTLRPFCNSVNSLLPLLCLNLNIADKHLESFQHFNCQKKNLLDVWHEFCLLMCWYVTKVQNYRISWLPNSCILLPSN